MNTYAYSHTPHFHRDFFHYVAAPVISHPSSLTNIVYLLNSSLTLSCTSEGSPPDTFTWMKDGVPITQSTSTTLISYNQTSVVFRSDYTISRLNTSDSGTYTCIVTNNIGSDNQTIGLTVVGM